MPASVREVQDEHRCEVACDDRPGDGEAEEEQLKAPIREQFERQGQPFYASARLWDDGVIDPIDTRRALGLALALTQAQRAPATQYGIFRM